MVKKWIKVREIKELITLSVSAAGTGLHLHLPKKLCEQYDIIAGDRIKVQLRFLYKRDWSREPGSYAHEAMQKAAQERKGKSNK